MAKDKYNLHSFKIIKPYVKGADQFTFSYEDYSGKKYTYNINKTKNPVSDQNMWAFWKQIDKFNGKDNVPLIWKDQNLKKMNEKGYIKIENIDGSPQLNLFTDQKSAEKIRLIASRILSKVYLTR